LERKHGVIIKEQDLIIKITTKQRLKGLFYKQGELHVQKVEDQKKRILKECMKLEVVCKALTQLIVI